MGAVVGRVELLGEGLHFIGILGAVHGLPADLVADIERALTATQ